MNWISIGVTTFFLLLPFLQLCYYLHRKIAASEAHLQDIKVQHRDTVERIKRTAAQMREISGDGYRLR